LTERTLRKAATEESTRFRIGSAKKRLSMEADPFSRIRVTGVTSHLRIYRRTQHRDSVRPGTADSENSRLGIPQCRRPENFCQWIQAGEWTRTGRNLFWNLWK